MLTQLVLCDLVMATQTTERSRLLGHQQAWANGKQAKQQFAPKRLEGFELYLALAFPYAASLLAAIGMRTLQ